MFSFLVTASPLSLSRSSSFLFSIHFFFNANQFDAFKQNDPFHKLSTMMMKSIYIFLMPRHILPNFERPSLDKERLGRYIRLRLCRRMKHLKYLIGIKTLLGLVLSYFFWFFFVLYKYNLSIFCVPL